MIITLQNLLDLGLSEHSHETIHVECGFRKSKKCRGQYDGVYKDLLITAKNHNGKIACLQCSKTIKASSVSKNTGRKNPNTKYFNLNDSFFDIIDTPEKAYILGLIASDGSIRKNEILISIKDKKELEEIRDNIEPKLPIKPLENNMWKLSICSKQMASACLRHLGLEKPGKKSSTAKFPDEIPDNLKWDFIRGYFDGDGSVNLAHGSAYPKCDIASNSKQMRFGIENFCKIPCSNSDKTNRIYWSGTNAIDFLGKIYDISKPTTRLHGKYMRYLEWCNWVPSLSGFGKYEAPLHCKWAKSTKEAIAPHKERASDSGFDLTLISVWKTIGNVTFYDTGIKVLPDHGWYMMCVPRSSMAKSGYMLANSVGIIDRSYVGTIKIPLYKIEETAPDLVLPARMVQLIPCLGVHAQMVEVFDEELDETNRGQNGFGSSGR